MVGASLAGVEGQPEGEQACARHALRVDESHHNNKEARRCGGRGVPRGRRRTGGALPETCGKRRKGGGKASDGLTEGRSGCSREELKGGSPSVMNFGGDSNWKEKGEAAKVGRSGLGLGK